MKKILSIFLFTLIFVNLFIQTDASERPKINLIYKHTGAGLGRDADILQRELWTLGYSVVCFHVNRTKPIRQADINIFLEEVNADYFSYAEKNYFIPNAEWYLESVDLIPEFTMILCKTRECERIFKQYHPNTVFLGFTSLDRYDPKVKKTYRQALHVAGKSQQKGTGAIVDAWRSNPNLPALMYLRYMGESDCKDINHLLYMGHFLNDKDLLCLQNECGLHLCPSETEGFGHYLMEALSTGAVVVTTDAPPMNEFVKDERCLAGYNRTKQQNLATNYYVDPLKLEQVMTNLMQLTDHELEEIGQRNREYYLECKQAFRDNLKAIFQLQAN